VSHYKYRHGSILYRSVEWVLNPTSGVRLPVDPPCEGIITGIVSLTFNQDNTGSSPVPRTIYRLTSPLDYDKKQPHLEKVRSNASPYQEKSNRPRPSHPEVRSEGREVEEALQQKEVKE
jgi:hypothetical protein